MAYNWRLVAPLNDEARPQCRAEPVVVFLLAAIPLSGVASPDSAQDCV